MFLIKSTKVLLAICGLACLPSCAWAWGTEGHRIIALIAADKLTPAARTQVSELLGGDAQGAMEAVSTWADEIRRDRPETAPWHYVNIEISTSGYDAAKDCRGGDCLVAQVQRDERIVADNRLAKPVRAEALRFLTHFIGDLHQPLHCADNHDRGGNDVRVMIGAMETTLHAVWDTNVVASLGESPDHVASELEAHITPEEEKSWSAGIPLDWADESFRVAKQVIYSSLHGEGGTTAPILLPPDYAARERSVTATQLERAGIRLAAVLNAALVSTDHPLLTEIIGPTSASSHVGQTVAVRGTADEVHTARSGVTFIDMGGRYPKNAFTAVIFAEDAGKFPDTASLVGRTLEITGRVRLYRGKPEIILKSTRQLKMK